jgi:hypothetical protein
VTEHKIYRMSFADIYPHYVAKIKKKGKTTSELHEIFEWLTGYIPNDLSNAVDDGRSIQEFFDNAPNLNPQRRLITGNICGVRVEEIVDPLMREIRYLDKLVDELARGKKMLSILRK